MPTRERFELALERLDPSRWTTFEQLASSFLSAEFPHLRTLSVPEGDAGRDATLFSPTGNDAVALQYSVQKDWSTKIRGTARRLRETFPQVKILIYVSNQVIGARADDLRRELQKDSAVFLDVRDRSWFLDRCDATLLQQEAAEKLAEAVVDPLLASRGIIESKGTALTTLESRAALVYLGLQWEDDSRQKGLTKLSFEAIVKSVLRETDPANRLPRRLVLERARQVLPSHPPETVDRFVEEALLRMTKRSVRHYEKVDEFCLTHEERERLRDRLADRETRDMALIQEIQSLLLVGSPNLSQDRQSLEVARIRRVAERYLMSRGEDFASHVASGTIPVPQPIEVRDVVIKDFAEHADEQPRVEETVAVVTDLLERPGVATQVYLRSIADSYTLLAFLRETPDVQGAVAKMFSYGEIWLDTNIILPVLAEALAEEPARRWTAVLRAADTAGMELRVTRGVVEEIERHINRSLTAHQRAAGTRWEGRLPFLYQMYLLSGRSTDRFEGWLETFRGNARPEDDIAEYLSANFNVRLGSLEKEVSEAPSELRMMVHEAFAEIHARRRQTHRIMAADPIAVSRLAQHDVENYVGVISKRRTEEVSALGYRAWWLTFDRAAFEVRSALLGSIAGKIPDSPTLSPDFLVNYLALGPVRAAIPKDVESMLPLITSGIGEFLPAELLGKAEQIRDTCRGLPETIVRRRVRDGLDEARRRLGVISQGGIAGVEEAVGDAVAEPREGIET